MQKFIRLLSMLCAFAGVALILSAVNNYMHISNAKKRAESTSQLVLTLDTTREVPQNDTITAKYPEDVLFETDARVAYVSGTMTLTVPRLGLDTVPVLDGTDDDTLNNSVGLFDVSQLPDDKAANENVVIAGHRGAAGCEFYDIDKMQSGDAIILEYNGIRYTYYYDETAIVSQNDWTPVHCNGFESVTLISCHPQNSSAQRICVTGRLASRENIADAGSSSVYGG